MNIAELLNRSALELIHLKSANTQLMSDLVLTIGRLNDETLSNWVLCVKKPDDRDCEHVKPGLISIVNDEQDGLYYIFDENHYFVWAPKDCFVTLKDYQIDAASVTETETQKAPYNDFQRLLTRCYDLSGLLSTPGSGEYLVMNENKGVIRLNYVPKSAFTSGLVKELLDTTQVNYTIFPTPNSFPSAYCTLLIILVP